VSFIPLRPSPFLTFNQFAVSPTKHFINTTNPNIKLGNLSGSVPFDLAFSLGRKTSKSIDEKVTVLLYGVGL
jgi:hypothetical protein